MFKKILIIPFILLSTFASAEEEKAEPKKELDIPKISEAFGHLIGKNLESLGFNFEMDKIIKGLEDSLAGKESPMDEAECVQAISLVQEDIYQTQAKENLTAAEKFLASNAKEKDVVELEPGKLQYKLEAAGNGEEVKAHFSPLIRYTGKFLDGKVFGASTEDELISLDETIPGFSKGIIGMKEGEKRTLYIHPELGYGTTGYLAPNSLLTFEIEVIKANAEKEVLTKTTDAKSEVDVELATPESSEATR